MNRESVKPDLVSHLANAWSLLHLSVETPARFPGWDAVVLTAAGETQAAIYSRQLAYARERGVIPPHTVTLVAPDPSGRRIGSGGATLNALQALSRAGGDKDVSAWRVLLIHAGGDSKRLPWASVFGKPFVPFPLLADPDRSILTLFDHLLALTAPVAAALTDGGLLTLTGDVLPLFDPAALVLPKHGALVVTTPVSLDLASRHGVVMADADGCVERLLQKASADELQAAGALVERGAALIDTGLYAFLGRAFAGLLDLALSRPDPVAVLVEAKREISLYEEIAAAFLPGAERGKAGIFATPPAEQDPLSELARRLHDAFEGQALFQFRADDFGFVHLGSNAEVIEHLTRPWGGQMPTRILAEAGALVSADSLVCGSALGAGTRLGSRSLVSGSRLGHHVEIGNRCIVAQTDVPDCVPLCVPDNHCLWQLPVANGVVPDALVTVCCGVDDNPKLDWHDSGATFCNRELRKWCADHGVERSDLWQTEEQDLTLWQAHLFPVHGVRAGLHLIRWMLARRPEDDRAREEWLESERLRLADLHQVTDVQRLFARQEECAAELVLRSLSRAIDGHLDRDIHALGSQLPTPEQRRQLTAWAPRAGESRAGALLVPASRRLQVCADLWRVSGNVDQAESAEHAAFSAVQDEVRDAIGEADTEPVAGLQGGTEHEVTLPVRFDLAGGWSDTPPYCLERPAGVLNFALSLSDGRPVGVHVQALAQPKWELRLDDGDQELTIGDSPDAGKVGCLTDPFNLLRTALVLTGYGDTHGISQGVRMRTWARVPRGSGLGTSSILGAAVVAALQRLAGRDGCDARVSDLVLKLEQMMTTGGGWQDQVGGLVPGVKFTSSVPVTPLRLNIEPVPLLPEVLEEFQQRFVIAYSGQDRLAKNVLQIVVSRYLRRDGRVIRAIDGLVGLAREARKVLATGALDDLGLILREVWRLHQQLDPHCSNPGVDAIFRQVDDLALGYKLAGAGGGGFMGILAKTPEAAGMIRNRLEAFGQGVRVYKWAVCV